MNFLHWESWRTAAYTEMHPSGRNCVAWLFAQELAGYILKSLSIFPTVNLSGPPAHVSLSRSGGLVNDWSPSEAPGMGGAAKSVAAACQSEPPVTLCQIKRLRGRNTEDARCRPARRYRTTPCTSVTTQSEMEWVWDGWSAFGHNRLNTSCFGRMINELTFRRYV